MGLAVIMIIGSAVLYWFLSRQQAREAAVRTALETGGAETEATVTRRWESEEKDHTPMIAYTFPANGRVYHGSSSTPRARWRNLPAGSALLVRYLPDRPQVNHPSDWEVHVTPAYLPALTSGLIGLTSLLLIWLTRRDTELLAEGRVAPAIVTGSVRGKHGFAAKYEFRLPDGTTRKGRGGQMRVAPEVGEAITVLYDDDHPRRNAPYPLELAQLDR